jgi:hypothetical protein
MLPSGSLGPSEDGFVAGFGRGATFVVFAAVVTAGFAAGVAETVGAGAAMTAMA